METNLNIADCVRETIRADGWVVMDICKGTETIMPLGLEHYALGALAVGFILVLFASAAVMIRDLVFGY